LAEADDGELLRRYVDADSEAAFTALVQRHFGVVYAAALRQVRDSHAARGVAQVVFTSLARHATALRHRTVLVGWLYTTTRYAAAKAIRAERRRGAREQRALDHGRDLARSGPPARLGRTSSRVGRIAQ
jgi:DNA-directed RNA polymerase specialized sigma24 family protein